MLFFLGFEKVAELLMEKGANVNIVGLNMDTLLTLASRKGIKHTSLHNTIILKFWTLFHNI